MRMRISTVLVGHERPAYLEALEKIEAFFADKMPDAIHRSVVVDNDRPRHEFERLGEGRMLIGGDNSLREFSAWDRGIAYLDRMRENPHFVHLATSAFDSLYTQYLDRFGSTLLEAAYRARAIVGHIDYYNEPIEVLDHTSQQWIRTSFFFVPAEVLHALGSVVSFDRSEQLFSDDPAEPFLPDAPISKRYRELIVSWLTGEGTGQGVVWHSRFTLCEDTLPLFRAKALAIVNEHLLSVRMRALGYPIVDVSWLAGQLAEQTAQGIDWRRPWRLQIEGRAK